MLVKLTQGCRITMNLVAAKYFREPLQTAFAALTRTLFLSPYVLFL